MNIKSFLKELDRERKHMLKQVERLEKGMAALAGLSGSSKSKAGARKRPKFSKAARERIAAAQRLRWKKIKAAQKK